jgi:alpha-tubulin suppressor-like RCC1 family protein
MARDSIGPLNQWPRGHLILAHSSRPSVEPNVPVAVSGLAGVKAISAGGFHSLALLSGGTVMAWGDDLEGQLGNGANISSNLPVAVKGLAGVKAVSAGFEHGLARK